MLLTKEGEATLGKGTKSLSTPTGLWLTIFVLFFARLIYSAVPEAATPPVLLTNAQQVLDLGIENARRATNFAALRGVVTFPVPGLNGVFVQDARRNTWGVFSKNWGWRAATPPPCVPWRF